MLIDYFIHGRGRGHATRAVVLAEALQLAGHEVRAYAGRDAAPLMPSAQPVHSLMPGMGWKTAPMLLRRVMQAIRPARPDLVISDGDLPGLVAARLRNIPAIAIGHGHVLSLCCRPPGVSPALWRTLGVDGRLNGAFSRCQVAVNFCPLTPKSSRTTVAPPRLRPALARAAEPDGPVVCYFRDSNGDRVMDALIELGHRPLLFSATPSHRTDIEQRELSQNGFMQALATARAVVASAGSQLLSECAALGIPLFALYADSDVEQHINTDMLRAAGLGDGAAFENFRPERLAAFLAMPAPSPSRWLLETPDVVDVVLEHCRKLGGAG